MAAFITLSWLHDMAIEDKWSASYEGWEELNRLRRALRIPEACPVSRPTVRDLSVPGVFIKRFLNGTDTEQGPLQ
jgi:hypothetical protein